MNSNLKKRVVLHIGSHKTGSTSLQAALSRSRQALFQAGIDYPNPWPEIQINKGKAGGNLAYMIREMGFITWPVLPAGFEKVPPAVAETARNSSLDTVLFSAEQCCRYPEEIVQLLAESLSEFSVSIVMFVRDPYDFTLSLWAQRVKRQQYDGSFQDFVAEKCSADDLEMFQGFRLFSRYFSDVRLINYDQHKRDIFTAFLQAAELPASPQALIGVAQGNTANRSLTFEQSNVVAAFQKAHGPDAAKGLSDYIMSNTPDSRSKFYSAELHGRILEAYASDLASINAGLPADAPLSTSVRSESDSSSQESENLARLEREFLALMQAYQRSTPLSSRLRNLVMKLSTPGWPLSFDPDRYALLNPDLPADTDFYQHYRLQGMKEGRKHRNKALDQHFSPR